MKITKFDKSSIPGIGALLFAVLVAVRLVSLFTFEHPSDQIQVQVTHSVSQSALFTAPVSPAVQAETISLNHASAEELESLPGINKQKAHAILAYRNAHGRFLCCKQLLEVKGIGPSTLEAILPYLTME